jgi:DNA-binding transcriptional MerR regulator/methylmalonyl-CoA mutase cobalamin-binding subunit
MLSIGALSRATGVPSETLRTWEARYGFPVPERKPSGHRLYPLSSIPRLRRIAEALNLGLRAGQVVPATEGQLQALLDSARPASSPGPLPVPEVVDTEELIALVQGFAGGSLSRHLLSEYARLGLVEFLEGRVAPLIRAVGEAWEEGRLEVSHEHFLSARVGDLLRSLRMPLDERADGARVVVAGLPGELHELGLQMAALALANAGWRVLFLGPDCPTADMLAVTKEVGARTLALSVSAAHRGSESSGRIRRLRRKLPARVGMLVGGDGAPKPSPGIEVVSSLRDLDAWARGPAGR